MLSTTVALQKAHAISRVAILAAILVLISCGFLFMPRPSSAQAQANGKGSISSPSQPEVTSTPLSTPTPTPTPALPGIPAGLPQHFSYGLFNRNTSVLPPGVPVEWRYAYLSGGVNTGNGWYTWNTDGAYVTQYIADSRSVNAGTALIYYQILQSAPNYDEFSNLQNPSTMNAYYLDWKRLMQRCANNGPVLINIEPDLNGVMQQDPSNTNDDASLQPSSVASSGFADVAGIPNTFRGFYQALAHIRDLYAPNVVLGLDAENLDATDDVVISLRNDPNFDWVGHATRESDYLNSIGPGFQMLFYSPLDRDAAYYQIQYGSNRWWDANNVTEPTFDTMGAWLNRIVTLTQKRVLMWQVPVGNRTYRTENNTTSHYQDNRSEYFLNSTSGRTHVAQWANFGVMGIMWGAGVDTQSEYWDESGDGITNPTPINGNNLVSTFPDDDGGYVRLGVGSYYSTGYVPLPGACFTLNDFTLLRNAYGRSVGQTGYDPRADFNSDGVVDSRDFALFLRGYGHC